MTLASIPGNASLKDGELPRPRQTPGAASEMLGGLKGVLGLVRGSAFGTAGSGDGAEAAGKGDITRAVGLGLETLGAPVGGE